MAGRAPFQAIDGGKINRFDLISGGLSAYMQVSEADIPNYWAYARQFVLADHYFTSVDGPIVPNFFYAVAAQSGGVIDDGAPGPGPDCAGNPSGAFAVLTNAGNITYQAPCFDFQTLADSLNAAGLTWKYYSEDGNAGVSPRFATSTTAPTTGITLRPLRSFLLTLRTGVCPR